MKMGILGAGRIAVTMAQTIAQMPDVTSWAVGARSLERAQKFAEEYGFEKAYGSYEELAADPELDLIYVATPHALHAEHIRLCLEHGKNVLAEKAFTLTADQAREVLALAEQKGLLLTEAIWTRYMPMRRKLEEVLESGGDWKAHLSLGQPVLLPAAQRTDRGPLPGRRGSAGYRRVLSELCLHGIRRRHQRNKGFRCSLGSGRRSGGFHHPVFTRTGRWRSCTATPRRNRTERA